MIALIRKSWTSLFGRRSAPAASADARSAPAARPAQAFEFEIAPNDPLLAYLLSVSSVVEIEKLHLDSPVLRQLREAGVKVVVPLISQGELIGLLNLGPRRSEQEYSADDRRLLNTLAAQAAPALRVAQLARQQQSEARERERIDQELRVARVIQQTLLPKEIPVLTGWQMAAYWQPARAVSGDFYDFIHFPDGSLGIIVGDVTDKGVPAALVMATTRSILRAVAERVVAPGETLKQVNDKLCPDIPANMFVTCLYVLLNPATGHIRFANAGHNLPYQRTGEGIVELRASGMPLGLLPEMDYEEHEAHLQPGDQLFLYSDGLIEAHNPGGDMFGFPRLREMMQVAACASDMIPCLVDALSGFTGPGWEQEDDVTFVSLAREEALLTPAQPDASQDHQAMEPEPGAGGTGSAGATGSAGVTGSDRVASHDEDWQPLAAFSLPSEAGNERQAMERVVQVVEALKLPPDRLERLKTAVSEAAMNAIEHGNKYRADLPVEIEVLVNRPAADVLAVRIRDYGGAEDMPASQDPDLDAKLAGLQSPRGWGLFLIKNMVDEMHVTSDGTHHTLELILHLEGAEK